MSRNNKRVSTSNNHNFSVAMSRNPSYMLIFLLFTCHFATFFISNNLSIFVKIAMSTGYMGSTTVLLSIILL